MEIEVETIVIIRPDSWATLMAQWYRICLTMQETHVLSLIQEDDTDAMEQLSPCDTTTESALEPGRYNY